MKRLEYLSLPATDHLREQNIDPTKYAGYHIGISVVNKNSAESNDWSGFYEVQSYK